MITLDDIAHLYPEAFIAWERGPHRLVREATSARFKIFNHPTLRSYPVCSIRVPGPVQISRLGNVIRPRTMLVWDAMIGAWVVSRKISAIGWAYRRPSPQEQEHERVCRAISVRKVSGWLVHGQLDRYDPVILGNHIHRMVENDLADLREGNVTPDEIADARFGIER